MLVNKLNLASVECCFFTIVSSESLASQELRKNVLHKQCLASRAHHSNSVYHSGARELLLVGTCNGYHLLQDIDGEPLGVLPAGLGAVTTEDEEDIDGRPPGGFYWWVR
jgi:hypothetical protein